MLFCFSFSSSSIFFIRFSFHFSYFYFRLKSLKIFLFYFRFLCRWFCVFCDKNFMELRHDIWSLCTNTHTHKCRHRLQCEKVEWMCMNGSIKNTIIHETLDLFTFNVDCLVPWAHIEPDKLRKNKEDSATINYVYWFEIILFHWFECTWFDYVKLYLASGWKCIALSIFWYNDCEF